jgi:hypothetical protein
MRFIRLPRLRRGRLIVLLIGLVVLALSVTQCSDGATLDTMLADYGPEVPVSQDAAKSFIGKVGTALQSSTSTRRVRLSITEREATSALAIGMQISEALQVLQTMTPEEVERAQETGRMEELLETRMAENPDLTWSERLRSALNPKLTLKDAQVRFTDSGQIVAAGYLQAWRWRQPALLVVSPRAASGELELDFVEGRLGRIPAPEWAFDRMGAMLSSMILMGQDYAEIEHLAVTDGRLVFAGSVTQ